MEVSKNGLTGLCELRQGWFDVLLDAMMPGINFKVKVRRKPRYVIEELY